MNRVIPAKKLKRNIFQLVDIRPPLQLADVFLCISL